eukprot:GHVP01021197.1.p1 GENE.GHVP01021197.1~~GHVP01021197.1.p1  ORF type:complete len:100 (+),score=15.16 GHVP01021197.1:33-302(+)
MSTTQDRFNPQAQLEHLQSKYTGTGHADTRKWDFASTILRDTEASHVGHHSRLAYFAVAENESIARVRYECLQRMTERVDLRSPSGQQN